MDARLGPDSMKLILSRLIAIGFLTLPALSHAWWNDDWAFRKPITVEPAAIESQPVLVRLHPGNFTFFTDLLPDGADLRFVAGDDKTALKHHIEKFDATNGMALIWVEMPAEKAKAGHLWMYYGNPKARSETDAAIYDKQYAAAYHFAAASLGQDQTANGQHAASVSAQPNPASIIGEGARFDGRGAVHIAASPALAMDPAHGWTWTAWGRIESPQSDAYLMQAQDGGHSVVLAINGTAVEARYTADGRTVKAVSSVPLSTGAWHHVAVTLGSADLSIYMDGAATGSAAIAPSAMQPAITIGSALDGSHGFTGDLDEMEISNVARSTAWLAAQVHIQGIDSPALGYGNDESRDSGAQGSYFKVILHNVTVDGWVVIVLLAVMAAMSWVVMAVKGLVIGRTRKDNRAFVEKFRTVGGADSLTALDAEDSADDRRLANSPFSLALMGGHDHFQSSTIYHLYHTGCQELGKRMAATVGARAASLTPQALDAIRAALDATLVRESQKLNGQMVLLTIAISGGPFLGLLGTVVGVMITFAAIAASGDVNVNAIAPGIAAALVATVAGLAVAIPALFGYNYLASRIKEITADMRVFVDEFVTRLAEIHS